MEKESKDKLKGIFIVPIGLALVLVPFSMLIGWNIITLLLFWFLLIPILTIYLPIVVSKKKSFS